MPQIGVGTEGYGQGPSVFDYPKLEPRAKDERARIFVPNPDDVWMECRHSIGGQRAAKGLPPGSPIPGWGGNWICTGRDDVLKSTNPMLDPEACIMCRMHRDGEAVVDKPTRKFVMQVGRYNTTPDGMQLMQPFGFALLVWLINDKEWGQMRTLHTSWGDLRRFDLLLVGISKDFKTWDVGIQPQAMWATNPQWVELVQQTYAQQHVPVSELALLIGRRATNENEILAKVQEVKSAGQPPQGYYAPQQGWPGQPPMPQPGYFPGAMPQPAMAAPVPELAGPPPLAGAPIPPAPMYAPPPQQVPAGVPAALTAPEAVAAPAAAAPPMMASPPMAPPAAIQPPTQQQFVMPMGMGAPPAGVDPGAYVPPMQAPPPMPQQQQPMPPMAPPTTLQPPATNGAPQQPVDFTAMLGVPPPPPPPA